jgi:hypothetical protein
MRHRRHRKLSEDAAEANIVSLRALQEQLAKDYTLIADDPRVSQAALVLLNQRHFEREILVGRPVPSSELQAYTNVIAALLGPPPIVKTLNVRYNYICFECRREDDKPDPRVCCSACGEVKSERPVHTSAPVAEPAPAMQAITGHPAARKPLVPLTGGLGERVALANVNNTPTPFRVSPYERFDNKLG